jgi:hypothetical protein
MPSIAVPIRLRAGGERVHAWYSNLNVTACGCTLASRHLELAKTVTCHRCLVALRSPPQVVQVIHDGIVTTGLLLARSGRSFMVVIRRPSIVWVPHKAVVMLQEQPAPASPRDRVVTSASPLPYRGPEHWREKTVFPANGKAASPAAVKANGSKPGPKTSRARGRYSTRKKGPGKERGQVALGG